MTTHITKTWFDGEKVVTQEIPESEVYKQEPVALETVYETVIHWDEGGGKRSRRELARRIVALYTAPPQRQPLTEIAEALRRHGLTLVETAKGYDVMKLGQITAHGIGGGE